MDMPSGNHTSSELGDEVCGGWRCCSLYGLWRYPYEGINEEVKRYMSTHDQYFLSQNHTGVHQWFCKRDCFVLMGCDEPKYHKSIQLEDGFLAFKKTEYNIHLLDEFIKYCCDERCVTDIPNTCGLPNLEGFKDHRTDLSYHHQSSTEV